MLKMIEENTKKLEAETNEWYQEMCIHHPMPEGIIIVEDIPYIKDNNHHHMMDIYCPKGMQDNLPVIFSYHGGGLLTCDHKICKWFASEMAKRGCLVFCIDYPLVPSCIVYDLLNDAYKGMAAAYKLIKTYGGDPDNITICGDSSGAFISTYLAAAQKNPVIAKALGIEVIPMDIHHAVSISGMFYTSRIDKNGIFLLRKSFYGKNYKKHPFWEFVNPECLAVQMNLPPMLCVTSDGDYLKKYTTDMAKAMLKQENVILKNYENKTLEHDFVTLQPMEKESQEFMDMIVKFISGK